MGTRSCAQVDRVALDINMDSSSKVTRGKVENILQIQGAWWVDRSALVLDSIVSMK